MAHTVACSFPPPDLINAIDSQGRFNCSLFDDTFFEFLSLDDLLF
jgi:hypothetical protein